MPGPPWTAKEKKALKRQVKREKRSLSEVEIDGRTVNAIRAQAVRMDLVSRRASRAKWSQQQLDRLKELQQAGFTPQQIYDGRLLGDPPRTKWSITKQWGRMHLADNRRSHLMKKKKRWAAGELEKFKAYLRRHSRKQTPEEIGKHWGVARSTVSRWQNELGVKATREQVMKMKYSLEKQQAARKRIRQANRQRWRERIQQREQSLHELAAELRSRERPPEEKQCSDCHVSWPRRREFFPVTEKKISIGTSRYYKQRCILCENSRRRKKKASST